MTQSIKSISNPKLSVNILTDAEVRQIHTATLDIIESAGVRFPSHKALDILEAHGATVDRSTMVAKIPGAIMEEYLALMPPAYTLAALDSRAGSPSGRQPQLPGHRWLRR